MPTNVAATAGQERCALVLASNLSDGAVIAEVLADTGAIIIAEQALVDDALELLAEFFAEQPPWSEVPLIILTAHIRWMPHGGKELRICHLCEARPCLNGQCGWRLWFIR